MREHNLSDHVVASKNPDVEKGIVTLSIGIYDPTPPKVDLVVSKVEEFRSKVMEEYNMTFPYVVYKLLLPVSEINSYNKIFLDITSDPSFHEELTDTIDGVTWIGFGQIVGGVRIVVANSDVSVNEVENWFRFLRKYFPENIPIVIEILPSQYKKSFIIYDVESEQYGGNKGGKSKNGDLLIEIGILFAIAIIVIVLVSLTYKFIKF